VSPPGHVPKIPSSEPPEPVGAKNGEQVLGSSSFDQYGKHQSNLKDLGRKGEVLAYIGRIHNLQDLKGLKDTQRN